MRSTREELPVGLRGKAALVFQKDEEVSVETAKLLALSPHLTSLDLCYTRLTDDALSALASSSSLTWLDIGYTQVTDTGVSALCGSNITSLDLQYTQVTDAGVLALAKSNLTSLDLCGTCVTDAGVVALASSPRLTFLDIRYTDVTGVGVVAMASSTSLTTILYDPMPLYEADDLTATLQRNKKKQIYIKLESMIELHFIPTVLLNIFAEYAVD